MNYSNGRMWDEYDKAMSRITDLEEELEKANARAEAAEARVHELQAALDAAINMNIEANAKVARLTAKLQSAKSEVDEILRAALSGDCDRYLNYDLQGNKYCKWGVVSRDIAAVFDVTEPSERAPSPLP